MLNGKIIGVVVPAFNEETQIGRVIETMPAFVDRILIMNDYSGDKTSDIVENYIDDLDIRMSIYKRISLIENKEKTHELMIELIDRFGLLPQEVKNLFKYTKVTHVLMVFQLFKLPYLYL